MSRRSLSPKRTDSGQAPENSESIGTFRELEKECRRKLKKSTRNTEKIDQQLLLHKSVLLAQEDAVQKTQTIISQLNREAAKEKAIQATARNGLKVFESSSVVESFAGHHEVRKVSENVYSCTCGNVMKNGNDAGITCDVLRMTVWTFEAEALPNNLCRSFTLENRIYTAEEMLSMVSMHASMPDRLIFGVLTILGGWNSWAVFSNSIGKEMRCQIQNCIRYPERAALLMRLPWTKFTKAMSCLNRELRLTVKLPKADNEGQILDESKFALIKAFIERFPLNE